MATGVLKFVEHHRETSPSAISASGSRRCRAAGHASRRVGTRLSDTAGAHNCRICCRGSDRHRARLVGQWLSERLGQSFIVDNRPGAATNIATELAVRAPPDGYTLLLVNATNA